MVTKLFFLLLFISNALPPAASSFTPRFRANLIRTTPTFNYAVAVARSKYRSSLFHSKATRRPVVPVQTEMKIGSGDYVMAFAVGTPPLHLIAEADTGSDLVWTQCEPCTNCFAQPMPLFDPVKSSSFVKVPCADPVCEALQKSSLQACNATECGYIYSYDNGDFTSGYLATDTFSIGGVTVPAVGFGCGTANQGSFGNSAGLVGLGRGGLSLVTQLGSPNFSYCLTSDLSKTSPILFGSLALFNGSNRIQSTPLVTNPNEETYYYVTLLGITVGDRLVPIPKGTFELKPDGSGGVIVDSGTTISSLDNIAYQLVKQAFLSQVNFPVADGARSGFDLCFNVGADVNATMPGMTLHFDGADMVLPQENYFALVDQQNGVLCLAMVAGSGMSLVGNVMQMNMHILYDLKHSVLSFQPTDCNNL